MMTRRLGYSANCTSLIVIALAGLATPAVAGDNAQPATAWQASREVNDSDMVTTGVARGRDRLDSATSTSSIKDNEITKLAPRSLADLFRNIPGVRVEGGSGEGLNSYTVRGLPLVNSGAKYVQLQEDGLPVLEFGDLAGAAPDLFLRADLNLASVESIRGGSASTFASNAPGGVINLISKTGDVEGGSVQLSAGLDHDSNRIDFDYGHRLGDGWRFHVGGFYREGDGPRATGYVATRGGQAKLNLTKQFDGGYIRFYGKVLDDKFPAYSTSPVVIGGSDANPVITNMPNFNAINDTLMSRYVTGVAGVDTAGNAVTNDLQNGYRVKAKSAGAELQFELGDWTFTERFRYSDMSGQADTLAPTLLLSADTALSVFADPGSSVVYASGPQKGATVKSNAVSGNGLLSFTSVGHTNIRSLRNVTNDFRTSRVWQISGGDLTTTAGIYKSTQTLARDSYSAIILQDIVGNGRSSLLDLVAANGTPVTNNGVFSLNSTQAPQRVDLDYDVLAPYASFNFHEGKLSVGGSVRYDSGKVTGVVNQGSGATGLTAATRSPVNYHYDYLSYSAGINYRVAESFSLFARHSLGARAGADALLFSPAISPTTGALLNKDAGHDTVRQTEAGLKFRKNGISLNLTAFYATTRETNVQSVPDDLGITTFVLVSRAYRTYGAEFEGGVRTGPFSVTGSATITGGEIRKAEIQSLIGNAPRHQPTLLYTLTPQYDVDRFTVGANLLGQTSSYAQDVNLLKMPGYATVGLFAQYRPVDRLVLGVNVSNLFDKRAITEIASGSLPASGIATARALYGRLVSASARFFF